jgi:hypothetical protein
MKTIATKFWVRLGDIGEYESFDSLQEVAAHLKENNVGELQGRYSSGILTSDYRSDNYISLFVGADDQPEMEHTISRAEYEELERAYSRT